MFRLLRVLAIEGTRDPISVSIVNEQPRQRHVAEIDARLLLSDAQRAFRTA